MHPICPPSRRVATGWCHLMDTPSTMIPPGRPPLPTRFGWGGRLSPLPALLASVYRASIGVVARPIADYVTIILQPAPLPRPLDPVVMCPQASNVAVDKDQLAPPATAVSAHWGCLARKQPMLYGCVSRPLAMLRSGSSSSVLAGHQPTRRESRPASACRCPGVD